MSSSIPDHPPLVDFPKEEFNSFIKTFTPGKLATFIDVTGLKDTTREPEMITMAEIARTYHCASVCIFPFEGLEVMPLLLKGSNVKNCYVIDFPLGNHNIDDKAGEANYAVMKTRQLRREGIGKVELDMVINVERFRKEPRYTLEEINAVCDAADGEVVKVIVRTSELTEEEIWSVSEIVAESKAQFIKTSTGMDAFGAKPDHVRIMRQVLGNVKGVKAAGGIADAMTAMKMMWAGARDKSLQHADKFRLGSSNALNIISTMSSLLSGADATVNTDIP